jgi:hypothetical protein
MSINPKSVSRFELWFTVIGFVIGLSASDHFIDLSREKAAQEQCARYCQENPKWNGNGEEVRLQKVEVRNLPSNQIDRNTRADCPYGDQDGKKDFP